jgi:hypothetical protein
MLQTRLVLLMVVILAGVADTAPMTSTAPPAAGQVVAITRDPDGGATVAGWACRIGNPSSIQVQLYVGELYPAAQLVTTTSANAVLSNPACGTGGTPHGFVLKVRPDVLFRYGGLQVSAYAALPNSAGIFAIDATHGATLPSYIPIGASPRNCDITDIASLKSCLARIGEFQQVTLRSDLTCTSAEECCGPDNAALFRLSRVTHRVLDGNGHTIHRGVGARTCKAIDISHAGDILIKDLSLDEGENVLPCELDVKDCPSTIAIGQSKKVRIDNTHIYFGKGYVIRVWGTDGFAFVHSSLSESGIIGLYVGHYKFAPSTNVVIADSIFAHTRTNALALQGAYGNREQPVLIINNVFVRNHWHGLWRVPGIKDGIATGGQVLIADASDVRFTNNIVTDSTCSNCNPARQVVGGVEIGDAPKPPAGVSGLVIDGNYIYSNEGTAFGQNPSTPVTDVTIKGNRVAGKIRLDLVRGPALREQNIVTPFFPRAKREAGLALSAAPRPGAPATPIYHCLRSGTEVYTRTKTCDYNGQLQSVMGFSYEPNYPTARPFYVCQSPKFAGDDNLSLDPKCEGGRTIAQLGFAIPK